MTADDDAQTNALKRRLEALESEKRELLAELARLQHGVQTSPRYPVSHDADLVAGVVVAVRRAFAPPSSYETRLRQKLLVTTAAFPNDIWKPLKRRLARAVSLRPPKI